MNGVSLAGRMVPEVGLEPTRRLDPRGILSPVRLPIPPLRHQSVAQKSTSVFYAISFMLSRAASSREDLTIRPNSCGVKGARTGPPSPRQACLPFSSRGKAGWGARQLGKYLWRTVLCALEVTRMMYCRMLHSFVQQPSPGQLKCSRRSSGAFE
jgi:hypothetical protein